MLSVSLIGMKLVPASLLKWMLSSDNSPVEQAMFH
jgi:hypothetical protein